jgi:hypothetical protein
LSRRSLDLHPCDPNLSQGLSSGSASLQPFVGPSLRLLETRRDRISRLRPKSDVRLTRAPISARKEYVESNGGKFIAIDWDRQALDLPKLVWPEAKFPSGTPLRCGTCGTEPASDFGPWVAGK